MTLRAALDRTLLLMRDELVATAPDGDLVDALTNTHVAIIADAENLASHSAQTAFITASLLMARSGHSVHLLAPDVELVGPQPPLPAGRIVSGLLAIGSDLLPGVRFSDAIPAGEADLVVALGNSGTSRSGKSSIRLNAADWEGSIELPSAGTFWRGTTWPLGGMASAALAVSEAFKCSMRKLLRHARNAEIFTEMFAPTTQVRFVLAPADTPKVAMLGEFDCVSGGAIAQAALYALARIPNVSGIVRVLEPELSDLTNLNRYMLLLRSHVGTRKARDIAELLSGTGLSVLPAEITFKPETAASISLKKVALVGVDDIPARWNVQRTRPEWLGIGATSHWSAMASFHQIGIGGCAQCLHPRDEEVVGPLPTVAFVSFWAALLTTVYFLKRSVSISNGASLNESIFMTPFHSDKPYRTPVPTRAGCPTCAHLRPTAP